MPFFSERGKKGQVQGNTQIKSFLSIKRSNYYCQDRPLYSTSTLGRLWEDWEGNLAEMSAVKHALSGPSD